MNRTRWLAPVLLIAITALSVGCASPGRTPVQTLREDGDRHYRMSEYDLAAADYQEIAFRYPGDWQAQYRLGLCLMELDRTAEARRALEIAHARRPDDRLVADALAEAMFRQGDEAKLFAFLRGRAESSRTPGAWLQLARYSLELNDPDSARVAIQTAIELDEGTSVEPYLAAAELGERLGDLDDAIRRLRQAYGIDPSDERVAERLIALGEIPGPTIALPPGR